MIEYTKNQSANAKFAIERNSKLDMSDIRKTKPVMMTGEGFICFMPNLAEPREDDNGRLSYDIAIAIPNTCPSIRALAAQLQVAHKGEYGTSRKAKFPLKKGNDYVEEHKENPEVKPEDKDKYDNLIDHIYFNAKTLFELNADGKEAQLIDNRMAPLDASDLNGGDIIRIQIAPYFYTTKGNRGTAVGLRSVQRLAKGDFSGGFTDTASAFAAVGVDEDDAAGAFASQADESIEDDFNGEEADTAAEEAAAAKAELAAKKKKADAAAKRKDNAAKKKADAAAAAAAAAEAEAEADEDDDDADLGDDSLFM